MGDVDIDALLEAPFQKDKPKDEVKDDKTVKRFSETKEEDRDSKRRRSNSPSTRRRSRSPDRRSDRSDRGSDRGRDRDRNRDRDRRSRSRDRDRRRRSRSRSPRRDSRDNRDRRRSRSGDRGGSEKDKDRDFERAKRREREDRDKKERELSKEDKAAVDADRDSRTVFAINLPIRASERNLFEFFEKAGRVVDIRLIADRNSRRSKGFGYVEYLERDSVQKALALSGSTYMGQPIIIQLTQAEKNRVPGSSVTTPTAASGPTRLYVGSLHFNISEDDLKDVFGQFGELDFINLHMDTETNRSKGYGFVQFKKADDAKRALAQVNGLEIAGRQIKVGLVNETNQITSTVAGSLGELDDDEGGGLSLNAQSRAMLMAKLGRGASAPMGMSMIPGIPGVITQMPMLNPALGISPMVNLAPSHCVLLKNMFDPEKEEHPDFHLDIKEDVMEECGKFGPVLHIFVDKDTQGHVYVKFKGIDGAQKAIAALNHRWFAGKMITAEFYAESTYAQKFPDSV